MVTIIKLAFDFDGVIADTNTEKKKWLKKYNINISNVDRTSFYTSLNQNLDISKIDSLYKQMSKDIFRPDVLDKTKPVTNAIDTIKNLSKYFEIFIITSRTEKMILSVNNWLKKYGIYDCIKQVISASFEEKQEVCLQENISFLCDDDLRHLVNKKIKTRILFGKQNISQKDIIVVDTWKQIEDLCLNSNIFKNSNLKQNVDVLGAEGIILCDNHIILGMQNKKRWYDFKGQKGALIKTIGGKIEPEDKGSSKKALLREIFEEIEGVEQKNISISEIPIFTKKICMSDLNPFDKYVSLTMSADFYVVNFTNITINSLLPNDLPALVAIPVNIFKSLNFAKIINFLELDKFSYVIKNKQELPDLCALFIPEEIKTLFNNESII